MGNESLPVICRTIKDYDKPGNWILVDLHRQDDGPDNKPADIVWKSMEDLPCILQENRKVDGGTDNRLRNATDVLHSIADSLPAYGVVLNIYLWPPNDVDKSDHILFLGALRRLKDWHNANITLCEPDPTPDTEFLQKFLSSAVCIDADGFKYTDDNLLWRGKFSICDKIENNGITIPGVSLHKMEDTRPDLTFPIKTLSRTQEVMETGELGRIFEVLDEVSLSSIQSILKTPHVYKLRLYQKHPYSQVLMSYIQQNDNTGILARLCIYPGHMPTPTCGDVGLSTTAWRDNIMADIQYVQEPDEDLQDNYEFLYFLITSPDKHSSVESFTAHVHLLQHPYNLHGDIVSAIYHQALLSNNGDNNKKCPDFNLNDLPVLCGDTLHDIEADLVTLQQEMLQGWKKTATIEELKLFLKDVRLKYLSKLAERLPRHSNSSKEVNLDVSFTVSEVGSSSSDWSERLIQQYEESQKRSISRIQSSESMPMSSPIQPCDVSKTVDIQNFLKFFDSKGCAAATNLSPIRRRHPNRAHSRLKQPDMTDLSLKEWPESKEVVSHDIYYNIDHRSEKINSHMNRLQEKYVKAETYSSCLTANVTFPKCVKRKPTSYQADLRRSPRKKAPKRSYDESVEFSQDQRKRVSITRLSDSMMPLSTIQERGANPRRHSSITPVPQGTSSNRRRSEVSSVAMTSTPVVRQIEKLRTQSDSTVNTPLNQSVVTKETRSERHKRKLQDIVDKALTDQGVDRSDPIFKSCSTRLFKVTKLFVMDLPTSRNLKEEMKNIAESQVKQVIEVDRNRLKSQESKNKKK